MPDLSYSPYSSYYPFIKSILNLQPQSSNQPLISIFSTTHIQSHPEKALIFFVHLKDNGEFSPYFFITTVFKSPLLQITASKPFFLDPHLRHSIFSKNLYLYLRPQVCPIGYGFFYPEPISNLNLPIRVIWPCSLIPYYMYMFVTCIYMYTLYVIQDPRP